MTCVRGHLCATGRLRSEITSSVTAVLLGWQLTSVFIELCYDVKNHNPGNPANSLTAGSEDSVTKTKVKRDLRFSLLQASGYTPPPPQKYLCSLLCLRADAVNDHITGRRCRPSVCFMFVSVQFWGAFAKLWKANIIIGRNGRSRNLKSEDIKKNLSREIKFY